MAATVDVELDLSGFAGIRTLVLARATAALRETFRIASSGLTQAATREFRARIPRRTGRAKRRAQVAFTAKGDRVFIRLHAPFYVAFVVSDARREALLRRYLNQLVIRARVIFPTVLPKYRI